MIIHLDKEYFAMADLAHQNCIDCGKCIKCCPIIDKDGRKPKAFLESLCSPSDNEFKDSISCLKCGYCKAVCPKNVDIGGLLYELKKVNVKFNKEKKYRKKYRVIESHQKNSFRKILINTSKDKKVFFPGCSLSANNPELVKRLSKLLKNNDIGLFSGCCASPSSISGDLSLFDKNKTLISNEFKNSAIDEVVVACSNCYIALQNIDGVKVTSIYTLLEEGNIVELDKVKSHDDRKYILHDPCPTRFEDHIHMSTRKLLNKSGIRFNEFKNNRKKTSCCGDGSMVSVLDIDMSENQLKKRVKEAETNSIISYCQSCVNNFRTQNNESKHILEFLIDIESNTSKNISTIQKWNNRYKISRYVNQIK